MVISIKLKGDTYIDFEIEEQDLRCVIGQRCRAAERKGKYYLYNFDTKQYVHRMIMVCPKGMVVDHIDGNPTNLKRSNLRVCTQSQNMKNKRKYSVTCKSKYKGVTRVVPINSTLKKPYRAYIDSDGKRVNLGYYATEEEGAIAYNEKAKELHGEYACLNVI